MNVPKVFTLVTSMLNVTILKVLTNVPVTLDLKATVSAVSISMNVLLVPMLVTPSVHVPTLSAHTTAHVIMDIWVMDLSALFHVLHFTILARMVS